MDFLPPIDRSRRSSVEILAGAVRQLSTLVLCSDSHDRDKRLVSLRKEIDEASSFKFLKSDCPSGHQAVSEIVLSLHGMRRDEAWEKQELVYASAQSCAATLAGLRFQENVFFEQYLMVTFAFSFFYKRMRRMSALLNRLCGLFAIKSLMLATNPF